jgi:copper transport protein
VIRRFLLVCGLALAAAAPAWAHAIVLGTDPPNGAVLASSPRTADVVFDDPVRVGTRNAAIRNADGTSVLAGKPFVKQSRTLVIPLEPRLRRGDYTVRWSIVSDDGHNEEGVIAFAIGSGGSAPTAALGTRGTVTWQQVAMRTTFFLGVLGAVGSAFFGLVVLRRVGDDRVRARRHAVLLGALFLIAFVGADALIRATPGSSTRFERVLDVAAPVAVGGVLAAAAALRWRWAIYAAWGAAAVLFVLPTLAGHALDGDQPRLLAPLGDLLHLGAAAVWLGGLASLLLVFPAADTAARGAAARRFSGFAIPLVLVLVAGGASRALTELDSVSQLWSTSYGRTLLVKSGLLLVLVALGWVNRRGLATGFSRLRPVTLAELLVLLVVVGAVGTLTDLRPGAARATAPAPTPTPPRVSKPPPAPPRGAFVDAGQAGPLAVGFAYKDGKAIVTLTNGSGDGVEDTPVTIDGRAGEDCGQGCFSGVVPGRSVAVDVGGTGLRFSVPERLRPATAEVNRLRRAFDSLKGVIIDERLSSGPGSLQISRFREAAPDRMAYVITGGSNPKLIGTQGIVIGDRRWDKLPGGRWLPGPQAPLSLPKAYWTAAARNAFLTAQDEVTFYDPSFPAWFRLRFDPGTGRVLTLRMIATAHFMHHRYSGFDRPVSISPPPSR